MFTSRLLAIALVLLAHLPLAAEIIPESLISVGRAPESVVRAWAGDYFVSLMEERLPTGGNDGQIVRVRNGVATEFSKGFRDPKGLTWNGTHLFVTDVDEVWRLSEDGARERLAGPSDFPGGVQYLNDILALPGGELVVTDMGARAKAIGPEGLWPLESPEGKAFPAEGAIFKISRQGSVSVLLRGNADIPCPNGICLDPEGGFLLVDFFSGNLVSLRDGAVTVLARGMRGADGVAVDSAGTLYVSQVTEGRLNRLAARGGLVDTCPMSAAAPADLIIVEDGPARSLVVPDTKNNRLHVLSLDAPFDPTDGRLTFGREEIKRGADDARRPMPEVTFTRDLALGAQAFRLVQEGGGYGIYASDTRGALYGALELAECLRLGVNLPKGGEVQAPHVLQRGIKFNIPLDLRTPSYSDNGDAAQANIAEVWKRDFWIRYLDAMARSRYNVLSLWSLHPFPSLVSVPEYPDVALADVWRTRASMAGVRDDLGRDMVTPEMLAEHEVVHRMTIQEKMDFWRWVMQYARDRGIDVYLFTWNVFTFGTAEKYGITADLNNPVTRTYFRASVRALLHEYPLLAGIGVTAGENMPLKDHSVKERWLWDAYGEGVRDALVKEPNRSFRLIHRYHWTNLGVIMKEWSEYPGPFDLSYKYSVAHMYSIPNPPFLKPALSGLPQGRRVWLTLRNDDIYSFRAGDPEYTRDYVRNLPPEGLLGGFYMGSDGYTWGVDALDRVEPAGGRPLFLEKHWYNFALWGRLSYNPELDEGRMEGWLRARHPSADARVLKNTLQSATRVMPYITRFFWGDIDIKWFPEACLSKERIRGFYTVLDFMRGESMPGAEVYSISEWQKAVAEGGTLNKTTPGQIADLLESTSRKALQGVERLRSTPLEDKELAETLADCENLAHLGLYYAWKVRGAVFLSLYARHGEPTDHKSSIEALTRAMEEWRRYASARNERYRPGLYNRIGYIDLEALTEKVAHDVVLARDFVRQ